MDGFDADGAAAAVVGALRPLGTALRGAQEKRYLKSDLEFLGVTLPDVRRVVKAAVREQLAAQPGHRADRAGTRPDREAAVSWALALWREPVHERRVAAVEILRLAEPGLTPADLAVIERLIRESRSWAYVDVLAGNIAGSIALRDPAGWRRIDGWAADADFWVRRSALLALLPGIRADGLDRARFVRYAGPMLAEKEFFIRKAIGWVLRETARREPAWVAAWTEEHLAAMSGVTFREAVRRLPAADRARLERARAAPP